MTLEVVENLLKNPSVVCRSQHQIISDSKLYYEGPWANTKGNKRYYRVVVKECRDGNWISTAHIRSKISCGEIIYKAGEK